VPVLDAGLSMKKKEPARRPALRTED